MNLTDRARSSERLRLLERATQGASAINTAQPARSINARLTIFDFWVERKLVEKHILPQGLSESDLCILCFTGINTSAGEVTHVSSITRMQKSFSRVTTMKRIRSLQKSGWIRTQKSQQDGRAVAVTLTNKAVKLLYDLSGELYARRGRAFLSEI